MTTLRDRFDEYDRENPQVYQKLVEYTRLLKSQGREHYGIKAVFERIRWHVDIETRDPNGFKVDNSVVAFFTRKLESDYPEFEGFYRKRQQRYAADMSEQVGLAGL